MATWPRTVKGPIPKTPKGSGKKKRAKRTRELRTKERDHKATVRRRDRYRCRFPRCGCRRLGFSLHVSHDTHKGAGGDPKGKRSTPAQMILLCGPRHQTGRISRHAGTLQLRNLTRRKKNGPVAFIVDVAPLWQMALTDKPLAAALHAGGVPGNGRIEIARERDVHELEPMEAWQRAALEALAAGAMKA